MNDEIVLRYIGNGALIEIPARDLTKQDLQNIAWTGWDAKKLIETGLYGPTNTEYQTQEPKPARKRGTK